MFKLISIVPLILVSHIALAQVKIKGRITDEYKKPVELAIVSLKQGSANAISAITDSTGYYVLKDVKKGNYNLSFRFISYQDTTLKISVTADTLIDMQLKNIRMLSEVVVKAKKPIFQREIDRFRFNVAETGLGIGNNIWNVLEKTPLVTASDDGAIQISGTTGAVVYINNKKKILSGTALKAYLSSVPADNLEAIEVITTPPSRYDAEGGAGIINIVTKKSKEEGFIGNAVLSARQTAVNSQAGNINLNNQQGKWNLYSTLYMGNKNREPESRKDIFYPAGNLSGLTQRTINSASKYRELYPGANMGADYQINPKHVVGLLFDYSGNWHKETRNARSADYYPGNELFTQTDNKDDINSQTYSLNLNYAGKLDSAGKTLSIDFDALKYQSAYHSMSITTALAAVKNNFRTSSPQDINNQSIKADFDWPVNKNTSFSFGLKSSFSKIDNNFLFENTIGADIWMADPNQSNAFKYNENINSVYGMWNYKANLKWSYQLGLRLENTIAKGWLDSKKVVDNNYANLFPTAFLKYTNKKKQSYVLALTSRITRPGYWDLNPFRTYTTDEAYFSGNPLLSPVKYYREELSHSLNGKFGSLTVQFAASQTIGEIYALPYNAGDTIINKKTNYGNKYSYTNAISYSNQFNPWWRFSGTILTGYVISRGEYGNDISIDNHTALLSLSTNQTFTLSKKFGFYGTLVANNTFPATIVNTRIGNRLDTEVRLRKSAGPFNITLAAQDLFKSNKDRYHIQLGDLQIRDNYYNDTRSVYLVLSYAFGKQSVKDKRDRDTGAEDVKGRLM
ncbi:outer membrane beta-barrel protein [Pedobacter nototheniae]|uniref:outer membrane beta-barrel protein n=1 Tax=Pedobacter nototheniae TaxID=2488994 RepID=UPI0029304A09|nr:outer membrane beta-barrel protein [Pedobacter nototheniae]